jgi:hypothetical protein
MRFFIYIRCVTATTAAQETDVKGTGTGKELECTSVGWSGLELVVFGHGLPAPQESRLTPA